jgi:hypothetical protein
LLRKEVEEDVMEFICETPCLYRGTHIKEGDVVIVQKGEIALCDEDNPKKGCGGKGCKKCGFTGRLRPPYHLVPNDKEAEAFQATIGEQAKAEKPAVEDDPAEKEKLIAEMEGMGKAVDPAWSLETLRNECISARRMKSGKNPKFKPFTDKAKALKKAAELNIEGAGEMDLKELNPTIKKAMKEEDAGQ